MTEEEYWPHLEYRVCREFAGMSDPQFRCLWCDGFIPWRYIFEDTEPRITGKAWICRGDEQNEWDFTFQLPAATTSRNDVDWASILPAENVTQWMRVDRDEKHIEIDPTSAVPDP